MGIADGNRKSGVGVGNGGSRPDDARGDSGAGFGGWTWSWPRALIGLVQLRAIIDGRTRWVWEHGGGVRDASGRIMAIEGIVQDITARVESDHALREAERRYHSLFDNAIEGIFRTSPDGRYLDANPALARIYGFESPQELIESLQRHRQPAVRGRRRAAKNSCASSRRAARVSGFESQVVPQERRCDLDFRERPRRVRRRRPWCSITKARSRTSPSASIYQARIEQQANYDR